MFITDAAMPHLTQIEIIHRLKDVGFTQEQAEAHAKISTEIHETTLVTKQDLKNLETRTDSEFTLVRKDISDLRKDMSNEFVSVRKEIEEVKREMNSKFALAAKDIETLKLDLTVRMTVVMGSLLTLFSAVQKFLIN